MREIFDQERAMTLGAVKQATGVLAILFLIVAAFAVKWLCLNGHS